MTWTVDTLEYPGSLQTLLSSIWASSSKDVYACGHNEINRGQFWHSEGSKWESIDLFQYVERSSWDLQKVFGFGKKDFWVIGARDREIAGYNFKESLVLQYNGSWKDHQLKYKTALIDIGGTSSSDLWACGRNGVVLFYNGYSWQADTIKINVKPGTENVLYGISEFNNEHLILAFTYNSTASQISYYQIQGTINNWHIVDSVLFDNQNVNNFYKWGDKGIFKSNYDKIYSYGSEGIWEWNNNLKEWTNILRLNYRIKGMYGVSENYLYATSAFGQIYFYNGNTWQLIKNIIADQEELDFVNVWTDGQEVFLIGQIISSYPMKTLIFHGK